jgi:hypothetical protein
VEVELQQLLNTWTKGDLSKSENIHLVRSK